MDGVEEEETITVPKNQFILSYGIVAATLIVLVLVLLVTMTAQTSRKSESNQAEVVAMTSTLVSNAIQNLQKERHRVFELFRTGQKMSNPDLVFQFTETDKAVELLKAFVEEKQATLTLLPGYSAGVLLESQLNKTALDNLRWGTATGEHQEKYVLDFYATRIQSLLNLAMGMTGDVTERSSGLLLAFVSYLHGREQLGLERSTVTDVFDGQGVTPIQTTTDLSKATSARDVYVNHLFHNFVPEPLWKMHREGIDEKLSKSAKIVNYLRDASFGALDRQCPITTTPTTTLTVHPTQTPDGTYTITPIGVNASGGVEQATSVDLVTPEPEEEAIEKSAVVWNENLSTQEALWARVEDQLALEVESKAEQYHAEQVDLFGWLVAGIIAWVMLVIFGIVLPVMWLLRGTTTTTQRGRGMDQLSYQADQRASLINRYTNAIARLDLESIEITDVEDPVEVSLVRLVDLLRGYRAFIPPAVLGAIQADDDNASSPQKDIDRPGVLRSWDNGKEGEILHGKEVASPIRSSKVRATKSATAQSILSRLNVSIRPKQASFVSCNLTNFNKFELKHAEAVSATVTSYSSIIDKVAKEQRGVVSQLVGDRVLIAFNAVVPNQMHNTHACRAALGIVKQCRGLKRYQHFANVDVHVAVTSGTVLVGATGSDGMRFIDIYGNLISDVYNLAQLNKVHSTAALCSKTVNEAVSHHFGTRPVDVVQTLAGGPQPVYELIQEQMADDDDWMHKGKHKHEAFDTGFKNLTKGDFPAAKESLVKHRDVQPDLPVLARLIEYCDKQVASGESSEGNVATYARSLQFSWQLFEGEEVRSVEVPKTTPAKAGKDKA